MRFRGRIVTVLLFEVQSGRADVLNEGIVLETETIDAFSRYVFKHFPTVYVIGLRQIDTGPQRLSMPFQRHDLSENFVLQLPRTVEEYRASLGKATRRNIKRYHTKLLTEYPDFQCRYYSGAEIEQAHFEALLDLSEAAISAKGKVFGIDPAFARGLWRLARECGFVMVASIDNKVCAGLICFRHGSYCFAHVVAHDRKYDAFWLGTLCYYLTICETIRHGDTVFNMGQLEYDYKTRLLAHKRNLDRIEVYRSYRHCLLRFD